MDKRIGAQYYTLRDFTRTIEDFEETCRKVKEIGYKIVQISGTPLDASEMKDVLEKYDLEVVTTHKGMDDFLNNLDYVIDYNKTLGSKLCGLGAMTPEYRGSVEDIRKFIKETNAIAEELQKEGMYFGYHNHAFEFAKFDGKTLMDRIIEETNPDAYHFIADTYWYQVGGVNPAAMIRRLGKRAMAVHFKDAAIYPEEGDRTAIAEIGEGNLDWDDIIKACEEAGVKWALVEQDTCRHDPFESMKMSYEYLTKKGFV